MKLLHVIANNFKNCNDSFEIDFVSKSKKTAEDKEYELQEIADDLHVYNTMAFIGKNASGKTTAVELLDACYSILGDFRLDGKPYSYENVELCIDFYHDGFIYRYETILKNADSIASKAIFMKQRLRKKKYYKSKVKARYHDEDFVDVEDIQFVNLEQDEESYRSCYSAYLNYEDVMNERINTGWYENRDISGTKYYLGKKYDVSTGKRIFTEKVKVIYTSDFTIDETSENVWVDKEAETEDGQVYIVNFL